MTILVGKINGLTHVYTQSEDTWKHFTVQRWAHWWHGIKKKSLTWKSINISPFAFIEKKERIAYVAATVITALLKICFILFVKAQDKSRFWNNLN